MQEVNDFYNELVEMSKALRKRTTRTISDVAFKEKITELFEQWKTIIEPKIDQTKQVDKSKLDMIALNITKLYNESKKRVSATVQVSALLLETSELLFREVIIPLKTTKNVVFHDQREDLLKRLNLSTKHFTIAVDYFDEAKSCFRFGLFRASTIMSISALESCLKADYYQNEGVEYNGRLFNLLNRYFSGDIKRLPKQYEEFSKTYVKIRNSFTHPEEFDYSETIVFNVLSTVMELIKSIEALY
jgi:hypothetical protein